MLEAPEQRANGTADQTIYSMMLRMAEDGEAFDHLVLAQAAEGRVENAGAYIVQPMSELCPVTEEKWA